MSKNRKRREGAPAPGEEVYVGSNGVRVAESLGKKWRLFGIVITEKEKWLISLLCSVSPPLYLVFEPILFVSLFKMADCTETGLS